MTDPQRRKIREEFNERIEHEIKLAKSRCFAEAERTRPTGSKNAEKPLLLHIGELMINKADRLLAVEERIVRPENDTSRLLNTVIADEIRKAGQEMMSASAGKPSPA